MNFAKLFLIWLMISTLNFKISSAQEVAEPYTARAYWLEEKNSTYLNVFDKKARGDSLTNAQMVWLNEYTQYLEDYFARMSDEEKLKYKEFKTQWDEEFLSKKESSESDILEESHKGVTPGKKYSLYNGIYGAAYGAAALGIFEIGGESAIAIPFITSGIGMVWPLLNKPRYLNLPYSSVMLARHGKLFGLLHGASLGLAVFGDEPSHPAQILAPMVIGSIGLGELGFQLGKKKNWAEGRIATYQYYGTLGPAVTCLGMISAGVEGGRPYGIAIPVSAVLGYWVGDRVYRKYQFTRGDMLAASSFGMYSAISGFGFISVTEEIEMLVPMATILAGTWASHAILKNKKLSVKQGWNINYLSGAGAILGLGVAFFAQGDSHHLYAIMASAGGIVGWAAGLKAQTKNPSGNSEINPPGKSSFSFRFTPENYFLNKQGLFSGNQKPFTDLPVFRASMTF